MDPTTAKTDEAVLASDQTADDFLAGIIPEEEYSRRRDVSIRTCQRDRRLRRAPPYIQLGKKIYYRVDAIRDWLLKRERVDVQQSEAPYAGTRPRRHHLTKSRSTLCSNAPTHPLDQQQLLGDDR